MTTIANTLRGSKSFLIDVCAYAVMSNHYHLVLRLDTEKARALGEDEVIARYGRLFKMPVLIERYLDGLRFQVKIRWHCGCDLRVNLSPRNASNKR